MVLHTTDSPDVTELIGKLQSDGLPNLFLPRPDNFIRVDELPMLGTGKIDLKGAQKMAEESILSSSRDPRARALP